MIEKLFGVDLIEFGKEFGINPLFHVIWIGIWYLIFRFTAKFIKNHVEGVKDKEIDRIIEERNKYQEMFLGKYMISSKKTEKKQRKKSKGKKR